VRLLEGMQADEVWLFGSRARGEAEAGSDLDLLVLVPESREARQCPLASSSLAGSRCAGVDGRRRGHMERMAASGPCGEYFALRGFTRGATSRQTRWMTSVAARWIGWPRPSAILRRQGA